MDAHEFVACWKREKETLLKTFQDSSTESKVSSAIASLNLSQEHLKTMNEILDTVLTDAFNSLLLGLDGDASIGGVQETYKIYDEQDRLISDCGDIEAAAWEQFYGVEEDQE